MSRTLFFALLIFAATFIRIPSINEGMPYFYNEDEAHHFNRVVSMMKSGDLNPHYFHKPSLHFYLRLPVAAASFLWAVKEGHIRSVREIKTRDEEGVGGYAFSASHPGIVKGNRAFSVLLGLLTVSLAFWTVVLLTESTLGAVAGGLIVALSPDMVQHGATIGVDNVMTFFCLLSVYCAVYFSEKRKIGWLYASAIAAGFAISTKYNALPIALVPLVAAMIPGERIEARSSLTLLTIAASFLAASPFILAEIPLFLDQLAYEIWHYKIAGHEGHTAEPGLGQARFYLSWFSKSAVGIPALLLCVVGARLLWVRNRAAAWLIVVYPLTFFLLMIDQRVNFTRNMISVIPFIAILVGIAIGRTKKQWLAALLVFVAAAYPAWSVFAVVESMQQIPESRRILEERLRAGEKKETAIGAELECSDSCLANVGVSEVPKSAGALELWANGFDRIVKRALPGDSGFLSLVDVIEGEVGDLRIAKNPQIQIFDVAAEKVSTEEKNRFLVSKDARPIRFAREGEAYVCSEGSEDYCWITQRVSRIYIDGLQTDSAFFGKDGLVPVELELMTPWEDQRARVTFEDFLAFIEVPKLTPGTFTRVQLELPYQELKSQGYFILTVDTIHSPARWTGLTDTRRLGLAVKSVKILPR